MNTVRDPQPWVRAVRASHDRLAGIAGSLDADGLRKQSYAKEWSIAQVLSHLGSGAEIFTLNLNAGLTGAEPPARADYAAIWDVWNARSPEDQATQSIAANEALVSRVESLGADELAAFSMHMFGMTMDMAGLLRMRLSEHAVHTWDIAVALDPAARIAQDAVALLIDGVPPMMRWMGKKPAAPMLIAVTATNPARAFTLDTAGVTLTPATSDTPAPASLELTAEALLRLVYGRLDESARASGEVRVSNVTLPYLQAVFPGF